MSFGFTGTAISGSTSEIQSYNQNASVSTADLIGKNGEYIAQQTYGAQISISIESVIKQGETYVNGATAGQTGTCVTTASNLTAGNTTYQRWSETKRIIGGTMPASIDLTGNTASVGGN